jgi:hypothetical protein
MPPEERSLGAFLAMLTGWQNQCHDGHRRYAAIGDYLAYRDMSELRALVWAQMQAGDRRAGAPAVPPDLPASALQQMPG